MSMTRTVFAASLTAAVLAEAMVAQQTATVPRVCATLPGNAAVSMPLRWSQGILQVFVDAQLLPANFVGHTITGLRLRRSTLPGDVAYPATSRTITVRGGFQQPPAAQMVGGVIQNRPPSTLVLFGPAPVTIAATPAPGPTTTVGESFVQIVFTTPLPVVAGTLFLEFESSDGPLSIESGQWVDAVWLEDGVDDGYVVAVGDGSCTTRTEPTRLRWTAAQGPVPGASVSVQVTGAPPTAAGAQGFGVAWLGIDPEGRASGPGYLGYGGSLTVLDAAMSGCHQWAPMDLVWFGPTDAAGAYTAAFTIPGGSAVNGVRLAVQGGWIDVSRAVLPLSMSNGLQLVCGSAGIANRCNSLFFPGTSTTSPWSPFVGQMPVVILDYQ